jgi:putative hydrolase of the HAD superfamily
MSAIKAVIFDYGKVLSLPPTVADWEKVSQRFGKSLQEFQTIYWGHREELDRGTLDNPSYWKAVGRDCGFEVSDAEAEQLIEGDNRQWTHVAEDVLAFSRDLRSKGFRTAILSNMERRMLAVMREKLHWLNEFDAQVYSCEIGLVKPQPESYRHCCERLGSLPAETVFLDDKRVNVEGARRVGLVSWIFQSAPDPVMQTGTPEITLGELRAQLLDAR